MLKSPKTSQARRLNKNKKIDRHDDDDYEEGDVTGYAVHQSVPGPVHSYTGIVDMGDTGDSTFNTNFQTYPTAGSKAGETKILFFVLIFTEINLFSFKSP